MPTDTARTYDLPALWTRQWGRLGGSRQRIAEAGAWRRQEVTPFVPIEGDNANAFRLHLPYATTMGRDLVNFLSRKDPGIRRVPSGAGPVAARTATKVEAFLQGCLRELRSEGELLWDAIVNHAVDDGEWGVLVVPRPVAWDSLIDFTRDEGNNGTIIHPYFRRDAQNRAYDPEQPGVFDLDYAKSTAAYKEYQRDAKARRLPFSVQILPPDMCLPIGLNPDGTVSALLVRSHRSVTQLRGDGFDWALAGPAGGAEALNAEGDFLLTLYELWTNSTVCYQVANHAGTVSYNTSMAGADGDGTAVLDLTPYGVQGVPGGYYYGAHFGGERDPDKRGYPYIWPILSLLRAGDQALSQLVAQGYNEIANAWLLDPTGIDPAYWTEDGKPISVRIESNRVNVVPGRPYPAATKGSSEGMARSLELILSQIGRHDLGGLLTGAAGENGFDTSVKMAGAQGNIAQIVNGCVQAYTKICEELLRLTDAMSAQLKEPIPVYSVRDPKTGTYKDLRELSGDDLDQDYGVEVYFPLKKGSNLSLAQAMHQWKMAGSISHVTWLEEGVGDEEPEKEIDRIWVQKYLESEEGTREVTRLIAKYSGDAEMQRLARLRQKGLVTEGGLPSVLQPARPAMPAMGPGQGAPDGIGPAGPVGNSLAGMAAGQSMQGPINAVTAAVGAPPETITPSPVGP